LVIEKTAPIIKGSMCKKPVGGLIFFNNNNIIMALEKHF